VRRAYMLPTLQQRIEETSIHQPTTHSYCNTVILVHVDWSMYTDKINPLMIVLLIAVPFMVVFFGIVPITISSASVQLQVLPWLVPT
jgi:hypothetical protein